MAEIYYQYDKITGAYMGSGVEYLDNSMVGSTELEPTPFEQDPTTFDFITMPYFVNGAWETKGI